MRYKLFGRTGLRVSEICLGTMTFGEEWGWGASKEESRRIFDAFAEAGGNFVDTANVYTGGTSERFVGEFIGGRRERFVVATKYTLNACPDDPNGGGNHRKSLVQSLEASLRRLGTDYVDVLWVHAWDPATPTEETVRALDDVVRAGKALYVGISDAPAWVVSRSVAIAELRGWSAFAGLQIEYSLIQRAPERDLLPMADALDLAVTAWGPMGGGMLSGKYGDGTNRPRGTRYHDEGWGNLYLTERNLRISQALSAVAAECGLPATRIAVAWVARRRGGVTIPIVGARSAGQFADNLRCLDVSLSDEQWRRLDEASAIELGFPHDFLARVAGFIYGSKRPLVDDHRRRA